MSEQLNAVPEAPQSTLVVPSQGGDVGNWGTIANGALQKLLNWTNAQVHNAGGVPSIQAGTLLARPAAAVAGRLYLVTDATPEPVLTRDAGAAWEVVGGAEYGSNANGSYVRYQDGTQICFLLVTNQAPPSATYVRGATTLPAAFVDSTYRLALATGDSDSIGYNTDRWHNAMLYAPQTTSFSWKLITSTAANYGVQVYGVAVGRWK